VVISCIPWLPIISYFEVIIALSTLRAQIPQSDTSSSRHKHWADINAYYLTVKVISNHALFSLKELFLLSLVLKGPSSAK
jgi:hypothetical protein